jgi:RNA polymerase sigma factor (sigma-70 family)
MGLIPDTRALGLADALTSLAERRDDKAWALLLDQAGAEIVRLCTRLTGDPSLADDAVQETLLQLRDDAGQFRPRSADSDGDAWRWIMRVATNTGLQLLRKGRRTRERDQRAGLRWKPSGEPPGANLERNECASALRRELAELAEPFRHAIVLHIMEGASFAEVALAQDVPEGTVKSRVSRGLERIRQRLGRSGIALTMLAIANALRDLSASEGAAAIASSSANLSQSKTLLATNVRATVSIPAKGFTMSTKVTITLTAVLCIGIVPLLKAQELQKTKPVPEKMVEPSISSSTAPPLTMDNLHAVVATDLIGNWQVDGEATCEANSSDPDFMALSADEKKKVLAAFNAMKFSVDANKILCEQSDGSEEQPYQVVEIAGDVMTIEVTLAGGEKKKNAVHFQNGKVRWEIDDIMFIMAKVAKNAIKP